MKTGVAVLVLAYGFSQFYRAFLAVIAPALQEDIGAMPDDLAFASGVWFVTFAVMQIPIGASLDRIGPRATASVLFAVGAAGGALLFAVAQSPLQISIAMGLIGVGCAPVLMSGYYIFAKTFAPAVFGTLAGAMLGLGSLGNLAGASPLAWAVTTFGWRQTMFGMAAASALIAILLWAFIKNPPKGTTTEGGSVLDVLKMPQLWPLFAMVLVNYAPAAGLRGLWAGPYVGDVYQADVTRIGLVTLVMGSAMIAGSFAYGPLERLFRTRKWVIVVGNLSGAVALLILWAAPAPGIWISTVLLAVIGFGGSSFPLLVAHGKAFLPAHLTGRGVTLINLFGIGGAGLAQFATAPLHRYGQAISDDPVTPYRLIFVAFAITSVCGVTAYLRMQDRTD